MPIEVEVLGFGVVEFPDDFNDDQVQTALNQRFSAQKLSPPAEQIGPTIPGGRPSATDPSGRVNRGLNREVKNFGSMKQLKEEFQPIMQESIFGLDPSKIPSGAHTDIPAVTIPISSAAKLATGIASYMTSPQGLIEIALAQTPVAPLVYAKWAKDMIQGGVESIDDLRITMKGMVDQWIGEQLANAFPGENVEPDKEVRMEAVQRIVDDALNAAVMLPGGAGAGVHAVSKARAAFRGPAPARAPAGATGTARPPMAEAESGSTPLSRAEMEAREAARKTTLTPEDQAYIDAERAALDTPIEVDEAPFILEKGQKAEDVPFALRRNKKPWEPGKFMRPDRARGVIEVNPVEFQKWITERKAAGADPQKIVHARLWEERFHLEIPDTAAKTLWANMTGWEKSIHEYSYTGEWGEAARNKSGYGTSPILWGQEAMRRRMQQLEGMGPSEIAEAVGVEKWSLKSLSILETTIRGIRETIKGKEGSNEAQAILDRIQANINGAKTIVEAGAAGSSEPGALRKDRRDRLQKAIDSLKEAKAAQKRATQPPLNKAEQAEVGPRLIDSWIEYFESRMERDGQGPQEPGAFNKYRELRPEERKTDDGTYLGQHHKVNGSWYERTSLWEDKPEKVTDPKIIDELEIADQTFRSEKQFLKKQENAIEYWNELVESAANDHEVLGAFDRSLLQAAGESGTMYGGAIERIIRDTVSADADGAKMSPMGERITAKLKELHPELFEFNKFLKQSFSERKREYLFGKLLDEGFDHERARDIFRLWDTDTDVRFEVGESSPVLARELDVFFRENSPSPYALNKRETKGLTQDKEWWTMETPGKELLESAMNGTFGDSLWNYWAKGRPEFEERIRRGHSTPDEAQLRDMLDKLAYVPESEWVTKYGIPEWHAKQLLKWFDSMEGTGEGRLDRLKRVVAEYGDLSDGSGQRRILELEQQSFPGALNKKHQPMTESEFQAYLAKLPRESREEALRARVKPGRAKKQTFDPNQESLFGEPVTARGVAGAEKSTPVSAKEAGAGVPEGAIGTAYEPITSQKLEAEAIQHIGPGKLDLDSFVESVHERYGPHVPAGLLEEVWRSQLWDSLLRASKKELTQIRQELELEKSFGTRELPEPPVDATKAIVTELKIGGVDRKARAQAMRSEARQLLLMAKIAPEKPPLQTAPKEIGAQTALPGFGLPPASRPRAKLKPVETRKQLEDRAHALESRAQIVEGGGEYETFAQTKHKAEEASKSQKYRLAVISGIGRKLIEQASKTKFRKPLDRTSITSEDIGWWRTGDPWRDISPEESANADRLGAILTDEARVSGRPVSESNSLAVMLDKKTGVVHLVSAYRDGRRGPVVTDPMRPGKFAPESIPIGERVNQYRTLYRMLLDEPVKDFHQSFKDIDAFNEAIGKAANETVRRNQEQAPFYRKAAGAEEADVQPQRRITDAEAGAVINSLHDTVDKILGPGSIRQHLAAMADNVPKAKALEGQMRLARTEIDRLYAKGRSQKVIEPEMSEAKAKLAQLEDQYDLVKPNWQAISGYQKIYSHLFRRNRNLTPHQALDLLYETIYTKAQASATGDAFIENVVKSYGRPDTGYVGPVREAAPSTTRELTMRDRVAPTTIRPSQLPPGTLPVERKPAPEPGLGRPGPPQPPRMLSAADAAAVAQRPAMTEGRLRATGEYEPGRPIEPGALNKFARAGGRKASDIVRDVITDPLNAYGGWMVNRLREAVKGRDDGGPATNFAADRFNEITDRHKQLYGELATEILDAARTEAGKPGKATTWMHGLNEFSADSATARTIGAIEGTTSVPKYAEKLVDLGRRGNLAIGRLYEGVAGTFKAGGSFQRNLNAMGYDLVRQGGGRLWNNWTRDLAAMNRRGVDQTRAFFTKWKELLDEAGPDFNKIEQVNQDFQRIYPKTITHLWDGTKWQPIMHADLFGYLEAAGRRATHTRAFREQFPNTLEGRTNFAEMDSAVRSELDATHQDIYDKVTRTLQGHPTDNYSRLGFMAPGRTIPEVFRFLNQTVGGVLSRMVLTGQMFLQPGELMMGATPQLLGYKNYLRAAARVKELYPLMEQTGTVNRVIYDWSFDPHSGFRSGAKITGNLLSKGFMEHFLNEAQEAMAAATAHVVAERITNNTLTRWERRMLPQTFKEMGFTRDQVVGIMRGDQALLGQFQRKAAAFLTSGNKAMSEGSALGANRLFNSIFRFQSYPMMKMNQVRQVWLNFRDAWKKGGTAKERRNATEQLARFVAGSAMQGAFAMALTTLAYKGLQGLTIAKEEAIDEPFKFFGESVLASWGGPLYLLWRSARYSGSMGLGEQATRMVFPYAIATEFWDMGQGQGRYRDKDTSQKIGEFLNRKMPGTRAIGTGLAMFGLSEQDKKLSAALEGYYRWRMQKFGVSSVERHLKEDARQKFRTAMKKAVDALVNGEYQDGDNQEFRSAIAEALGETKDLDWGSIRKSLVARKVLKTPDGKELNADEIEDLRKRIGSEAVGRLQYYNTMLDAAAEGELIGKHPLNNY